MTLRQYPELVTALPAFNEVGTVANVVQSLLSFGDVVVIDDGSSDGTGDLAHAAGANVITHPINQGYDKALQSGLSWVANKGYRYAITLDADGQHNSSAVLLFKTQLEAGADVVIGVRNRMQRWSELLFSFISKTLWGLDDPLCGMKGYRVDLLLTPGRFNTYLSIGTEFCIRAARSGCRIHQVPITTLSRNGAPRFGSGLIANFRILRALFLGILKAKPF